MGVNIRWRTALVFMMQNICNPCDMDTPFSDSVILMFVLLNPFLMTIYLMELMQTLDARTFFKVLARATLIAGLIFLAFAASGDSLFTELFHVRFAAFLIFGGALFFIIGIRYVLDGPAAVTRLRGAPEHVAGSIAMPFMVGPATVNASILTGSQLPLWSAALAIAVALALVVLCVIALKVLHDRVRERHEHLVERYVEIVGRSSALLIGSIAVDMILRGIDLWQAAAAT